MAMTESEKKDIKDLITDGFKTQREWIEATLNPIQKSVDKHNSLINEVPVIKLRLDTHIDTHTTDKSNKKFNIEMWVIVGVYLLDKIMLYFKG